MISKIDDKNHKKMIERTKNKEKSFDEWFGDKSFNNNSQQNIENKTFISERKSYVDLHTNNSFLSKI